MAWRKSAATANMCVAHFCAPADQCGAIAQLGERLVRNEEVVGSSPTSSTKSFMAKSEPHFILVLSRAFIPADAL